jgi:hypothetical protein
MIGANALFSPISLLNAPTRHGRRPSALFSAKNRDTPAHHLDRHKQKIGRSPAYTFLCENEDTPSQELRRKTKIKAFLTAHTSCTTPTPPDGGEVYQQHE